VKILEVCLNSALGGLELYFHTCCLALRDAGHEIVSLRLPDSRLHKLAEKDAVPVITMSIKGRWFPLAKAWELREIITSNQIEIVHGHFKDDIPLLALTRLITRHRFKIIFTRQMPMPHRKKDIYHRFIYSKIDLFITITEQLKKDALRKLPIQNNKIVRLYYGVSEPPKKDENYLHDFLSISQPGDFNIGVFSRIVHLKGQHMVIRAAAILHKMNIPVKIYLVGDVMNEEYKQSLVDEIALHNLSGHVRFCGFISEPMRAMQGLDVLVLPSQSEAFGLVLIEAMRCGVAVLGVGAGGVPEIIDHQRTGQLFEWDNVTQLAEQLQELYRNPEKRTKLALQGKHKADKEFNSKLHFEKLEALFSSVLNN